MDPILILNKYSLMNILNFYLIDVLVTSYIWLRGGLVRI